MNLQGVDMHNIVQLLSVSTLPYHPCKTLDSCYTLLSVSTLPYHPCKTLDSCYTLLSVSSLVGMRLLCSKIHHLCYARMLQTMSDYVLGVSLLCMQQVNQLTEFS